VQAARAAGVSAVHYLPEAEHRRRREREAGFHARPDALRRALRDSLAGGMTGHGHPEAYAYGRRSALLFVGFVCRVLEGAVAAGLDRLYYFTREGEFFLEIHRRLADSDVFGFPLPEARLLHVSRLATFAGSLRELSTGELMRLWNQYSVQSPAALLRSLAMDPRRFAAAAAAHGLAMEEPVQYPWQDARVIAFLDDPAVRAGMEAELADRRRALFAYLAAAGLDEGTGRAGIVDIGWRGTIQDNLAHALPQATWHGWYLGLNRFLNAQPGNARKEAFGPDLNGSEADRHLLDFVAPVEMLCNSPNGSVTGYAPGADGVRVHRHVDDEENRVFEDCSRHFQAGVLDALPFWADFLRTHAYAAAELRPLALEIWADIVDRPPAFLARAYFSLVHNETFGVGGFSDKRRRPGAADVLKAFLRRSDRIRLQAALAEAGWVPGLLASPDVEPGFRRLLRLYLGLRTLRNRARARFARR
jgi:hypothetical protein